jgi:hypothetical protein
VQPRAYVDRTAAAVVGILDETGHPPEGIWMKVLLPMHASTSREFSVTARQARAAWRLRGISSPEAANKLAGGRPRTNYGIIGF